MPYLHAMENFLLGELAQEPVPQSNVFSSSLWAPCSIRAKEAKMGQQMWAFGIHFLPSSKLPAFQRTSTPLYTAS